MLASILVQSRRNNRRDDITGALICRHDLYLQLIEGPEPAIDALYSKITADDRHSNVLLALTDNVGKRMFPEWEMLDDDMPTLTWTPNEIAGGAIEAASAETLLAIFETVAANGRTRAPDD